MVTNSLENINYEQLVFCSSAIVVGRYLCWRLLPSIGEIGVGLVYAWLVVSEEVSDLNFVIMEIEPKKC